MQKIDRNLRIQAMNGQSYFLVEVIAHILCHLKEKVLRDRRFKLSDIHWVITVPAIWHARAKKMMREAGYKVCYLYTSTQLFRHFVQLT